MPVSFRRVIGLSTLIQICTHASSTRYKLSSLCPCVRRAKTWIRPMLLHHREPRGKSYIYISYVDPKDGSLANVRLRLFSHAKKEYMKLFDRTSGCCWTIVGKVCSKANGKCPTYHKVQIGSIHSFVNADPGCISFSLHLCPTVFVKGV